LIFAGIFSGLFVRTELGSFFTEHLNWFILGWISYFLYTFLENHPDTLKRIPISIGFTLIACIGLYFSNEINEFIRPKGDPKLPAFLPFLAWLVFFGFIIDSLKDSTSKASSIFRWFFENRFLIHLGKNSYSTYLLHVPILSVVVHMILINNFCSDRWHLFVVTLSISIPVIMIISHLAYILRIHVLEWDLKLRRRWLNSN
jgi:peptidoglycan/LPS O-acetylase OafA/YrhL